ncbi:magnesium chelatase subunit D [Asanoa ferruginea]|uniref:Mg-protoporphyrin IX chelatase n=1 Tax=Asanoa ferruginea TaxID=53367 RepID=A0A3D9ZLJ6_9ACTN|nr:VWA domain-containing protein [Asanoa ferruginea]REF98266.1 magnesium chelatase subunit D [Asanoa ferruginea]GIF50542.1 magnesium chelatase [Asanoa ferruginea]
MSTAYPFSAVVGLADLRQALLLNAVAPVIGGVLVRGEKGTAKSTMVRALAALLPDIAVVAGCRFACDPAAPDPGCPDGPHPAGDPLVRRSRLVELPVGATEDRVVGTLDVQRFLTEGTKAYEPGLLAAAHRGALYVDEVNLLPDHLVDLLLDSAAMGRAFVERDGVSLRHAARFLLVGTMNPEEGEPRPQLVDRFGLVVEVGAPTEPGDRAEVVRRRLAYEADPEGFAARFAEADADTAERIVAARARLPKVTLPDPALDRIARICLAYGVDGLRADIVIARTAVALAAWRDRSVVTDREVDDAARLALPHRRRRDPFDPPGADQQALDDALAQAGESEAPDGPGPEPDDPGPNDGGARPDGPQPDDRGPSEGGPGPDDPRPDAGGPGSGGAAAPDAEDRPGGAPATAPPATPAPIGATYRTRTLTARSRGRYGHSGRRSPAYAARGRVAGSRAPRGRIGALHLPDTVLAAARDHLVERIGAVHLPDTAPARVRDRRGRRIVIRQQHLREAVHIGREANLVLFVVDASGSMAARQRMATVKRAVLSLLRDAYQRRDTVGMITFRDRDATTVLRPTASHEVGVRRLADLRTGGRTPLAAGLTAAARTLAGERRRDPLRRPLLVVVTDGRFTRGPDPRTVAPALAGVPSVVVDCESGPVRLGMARTLAGALDAEYLPLAALSARALKAV